MVPVTASTMPRSENPQFDTTSSRPGDRPGSARFRSLSRGQSVAVAVSVLLALVVFGYGMVGSYVTVSDLAARRGIPLAAFVPAGIDVGLISVVVLDLVLAWVGMPVGWLRQVVRVLSFGTIVANAVPGWPDPVAVGLHAAAPVMLLATVEAGRSVLLHRLGLESGITRDPIPPARWPPGPLAHRPALAPHDPVADHQLPHCGGYGAGHPPRDDAAAPALWPSLAAMRSR
jgi:hypothetical protein